MQSLTKIIVIVCLSIRNAWKYLLVEGLSPPGAGEGSPFLTPRRHHFLPPVCHPFWPPVCHHFWPPVKNGPTVLSTFGEIFDHFDSFELYQTSRWKKTSEQWYIHTFCIYFPEEPFNMTFCIFIFVFGSSDNSVPLGWLILNFWPKCPIFMS